MTRAERWLLDVANVLVGGTGLVYLVMKHLMAPADEWAVVNHPWQPHVQHLHVVAAPLLVFVGGLLWKHHVVRKYREGPATGRATGIVLTVQFLPMVLSGSLIQVAVSDAWRTAWIWVHLICSGLWLLMAIAHRVRALSGRRAREQP